MTLCHSFNHLGLAFLSCKKVLIINSTCEEKKLLLVSVYLNCFMGCRILSFLRIVHIPIEVLSNLMDQNLTFIRAGFLCLNVGF
jgi:hypothetical protein